jgi:hypothetical protein
MGRVVHFNTTLVRPSDATQYAAGDEISNSATAGSVVRPVFDFTGFTRGRILDMSLDITPASSNLVITALNLDAILFKTPDVPAAVGDNVTFPITGAQRRLQVGRFLFDDGGWQNPLGAYTASTSGYQVVSAGQPVPIATPTLFDTYEHAAWFDFTGQTAAQRELTLVLQALAAWNPGAVVNTIGIHLTAEVE